MPHESIVATLAILHIDLEKEITMDRMEMPLLNTEQLQRELSFRVAVSAVKKMRESGQITKTEYEKAVVVFNRRLMPVWGNCINT